MSSSIETARSVLAVALEIEPEAVAADASIDTTDRWDSIAHMRLILAIEQAIDRPLEPIEVAGVFSLKDIDGLLSREAGSRQRTD